jgi:hypothetical protein
MQTGKHVAVHAERLSDIEAGIGPAHSVIRLGVTKALFDLNLDPQRQERDPTNAAP